MRKGVKIFIGALIIAIIVLLVGPVILSIFTGGGFDPS